MHPEPLSTCCSFFCISPPFLKPPSLQKAQPDTSSGLLVSSFYSPATLTLWVLSSLSTSCASLDLLSTCSLLRLPYMHLHLAQLLLIVFNPARNLLSEPSLILSLVQVHLLCFHSSCSASFAYCKAVMCSCLFHWIGNSRCVFISAFKSRATSPGLDP